MAGRAASQQSFSLGQQDEITIKTKKPASNSSLEIRDNILREYFGFTGNDIEAFKRLENESFCITQSGEKTWATASQVREWRTEPDGKLAIPTSIKIVNNVNSFRNQRASFEIFKVAMLVSDLAIKKLVANDLEKILLTSGQTRIDAINNLMITIASSSSSRHEIFQALRFLANESGYKNNPFLLIAIARTQVFVNYASPFDNPVYDQSLIANAVKSANDNLYSSNPKINNLEAATINQIASRLYDEAHANNKATNRRMDRQIFKYV